MIVNHLNRKDRQARIISEKEHTILYHALEDGKIFNYNIARRSKDFWNEYG